ncbi:MAG: dTDP-4-dehydrorhamnose reductase [Pseudomonadota bacterium]
MNTYSPILLTGANGQVGYEVTRLARERGCALTALTRRQLDIGDGEAVEQIISQLHPSLVINAAAYTAVDKAEQDVEAAMRANRQGPANLAASCRNHQIPLIHLSTDYVFDGCKAGAYDEDDPVAPTGVYGLSKWEGEEEIRTRLRQHLILRVSWVFGPHGHNFVKTMLRLAAERDELRVVADQRGCPTCATHIAEALLTLAGKIREGIDDTTWGTYHFCGLPETTWHGFAETIIKEACNFGLLYHVIPIHPIATSDYPTPARRPQNSVLDCHKIMRTFDMSPPNWQEGLTAMLNMQANVHMHIDSLDHLVLTVKDLKTTSSFYANVLGMEISTSDTGRTALLFGSQKINLHEYGNECEPKAERPTPGSADVCFITSVPLANVLNHLYSCNVAVIEGPIQRSGAAGPILSIYFRDPDMNLIEVSNRITAA